MKNVEVNLYDAESFVLPKGEYDSIARAFVNPFLRLDEVERRYVIIEIQNYDIDITNDGETENFSPQNGVIINSKDGFTWGLRPGEYTSFRELFHSNVHFFTIDKRLSIREDIKFLSRVLDKLISAQSSSPTFAKDVEILYNIAKEEYFNSSRRIRRDVENKNVDRKIYIYTDIIKPQLVGDSLSRCLRVLHVNDNQHHVFNPVYYFPVEKKNLESIEILLADKFGETVPFRSGQESSIIVLHFIKRKHE